MGVVQAQIAGFSIYSYWTVSNGTIVSGPTTGTEQKTFGIVGIPSGAEIKNAVITFYASTTYTGAQIFTCNGVNCVRSSENAIPITVTGNGSYTATFVFKCNGNAALSDGQKIDKLTITDPILTVTYDEGEQPEPEPEPEEHIANEQIAVFPPTATEFVGNGLVTLNPVECVITEQAGGEYELEIVCPIDGWGKWQYLIEDYIIRSPVPERRTPRIIIPAASFWEVKSSVTTTPLYSQLPYYTRTKTPVDEIRNNPTHYQWQYSEVYTPGTYVVAGNAIYICRRNVQYISPTSGSDAWEYVASVSGSDSGGSGGGETIYHEGTVAENIPGGEIVAFVADYNDSYMRVRSLRGIVGFIRKNDCEQTGDSGYETTIKPRIITEQAFRIYRVTVDSEDGTVTANARHKSYDFQANSILDCKLVEADPQTAIAIMQGSLLNADNRLIACDIAEGSISTEWSWNNPVFALLDPDEGLAKMLRAQVIRDNDDFFLLANDNPDTGAKIKYGVNMLGVTWERSTDETITRIVPRGKDKDGNDLFLPELYIDSEIADRYPFPRVEILDCDCKEGEEIEHADGTKETLTRDRCYEIMRDTAAKRYNDDKCDAVAVTLGVRFLLLGDTEEYKQYKGLQSVKLYDALPIENEKIGLESTAQVSYYAWDVLRKQYNEIELGDVFSYGGRTVAGYNVTDGAVSWRKLAPGLIDKIRNAN